MSAPGPPWTPEEDGLLRSMGAAGESATAIATLLKRKAAGVHQRAHFDLPPKKWTGLSCF
jgi:hypothetical protein